MAKKTLSEVQQVREHLKPLRRLLDDLDAAIDETVNLRSDNSHFKNENPKLKDEIAALIAQKVEVEQELKAKKEEHSKSMSSMNKSFEAKATDIREKTDALIAKHDKAEAHYAAVSATMETEYSERLATLRAQVTAEENKLESLRRAKEAAKAVVAGL